MKRIILWSLVAVAVGATAVWVTSAASAAPSSDNPPLRAGVVGAQAAPAPPAQVSVNYPQRDPDASRAMLEKMMENADQTSGRFTPDGPLVPYPPMPLN